jgi:short subunit dehydrogenase-like uncharacterized protein
VPSSPIGIVGAYGATGSVVARTLGAQGEYPLVLIGRNESKLRELATEIDGNAAVIAADVMDDDALASACAQCRTIVNCAAPASVILDRVARAALVAGCHYVDAGSDPRVFDWLSSQREQITSRGLTYLLAAGYVPGLSEMMVRASYEVHRGKTDSSCEVRLFVVDRNDWSLNGIVDTMERFCRHPPEIGVYRQGRFRSQSMMRAWMRRQLPGQHATEVMMPVRWPEIEEFISTAQPQQVAAFIPFDPVIYMIGRFFALLAPSRLDLAARIAKAVFRLKARRQGGGGILYVEASGRRDRTELRWLIEVPQGHHYERTGQVAALAAALVSDGTVRTDGVRYLAHAVDPHEFIVRLLVWGVETVDLSLEADGERRLVR